MEAVLRNPRVTASGKTILFPVEMTSGCYLEFYSPTDCGLYGKHGELIAEVIPDGEAPAIVNGRNELTFHCEAAPAVRARARVTVIGYGEPLGK